MMTQNLKRSKERGKYMNNQKSDFHGTMVFCAFFTLFLSLFFQVPTASAVPSFARQTGFPCKSCHMTPPELTALGRAFKLNGYTMVGKPTVTSKGTSKSRRAQHPGVIPAFRVVRYLPSPPCDPQCRLTKAEIQRLLKTEVFSFPRTLHSSWQAPGPLTLAASCR